MGTFPIQANRQNHLRSRTAYLSTVTSQAYPGNRCIRTHSANVYCVRKSTIFSSDVILHPSKRGMCWQVQKSLPALTSHTCNVRQMPLPVLWFLNGADFCLYLFRRCHAPRPYQIAGGKRMQNASLTTNHRVFMNELAVHINILISLQFGITLKTRTQIQLYRRQRLLNILEHVCILLRISWISLFLSPVQSSIVTVQKISAVFNSATSILQFINWISHNYECEHSISKESPATSLTISALVNSATRTCFSPLVWS